MSLVVTRSRHPQHRRFDLLALPVIGRLLGWRHARTSAQVLVLVVASLVVFDGLLGPPQAAKNLAGVLPWVHWRGLIVLAILIAGNLFCFACPFMLPRRLAKRLLPANRAWPTRLRGKWIALALLVLFFWSYEVFDLWASPWLTAWLTITYFVAAFVIDGFFKGAAFCKYLCPIGQFHFVNSVVSPFEIAVRHPSVCADCTTKDCIRGRPATGPVRVDGPLARWRASTNQSPLEATAHRPLVSRRASQNGCELWLFQEQKVGNLDCTFCLDCVQACPHDNVGILARLPAHELLDDSRRSSIGRLSERPDLAALLLVLVFSAMSNAFGMVGPAHTMLRTIGGLLGTSSEALILALFFAFYTLLLPVILVGLATLISRWLMPVSEPFRRTATRASFALAPLGLAMWLTHYGFHFFSGGLTIVPVIQSFLRDLGWPVLGAANWDLVELIPHQVLLPLEHIVLLVGGAAGLMLAFQIARRQQATTLKALVAWLPWASLIVLLVMVQIWLMNQPMEMRGTILI